MTTIEISKNIINNSNYDISYLEYNRNSIPWKINTTYICQDNQVYRQGEFSQEFVNINNNLIIESSQNNIILSTSKNNRVEVKNNMKINNNLDVSSISAKIVVADDISLSRILYVCKPSTLDPFNIVGDVNIDGNFTFRSTLGGNSSFSFATITNSSFTGGTINTTSIASSTLTIVDICNSTINNTRIGELSPTTGAFTSINSNTLVLDKTIGNRTGQIKFFNSANDIITIKNNDSKLLDIDRHLNISSTGTSVFNGNITCDTITYKRLDPDICLNNYTNVSFGNFTISGNIILTKDISFNIGSNNNKFNNIYSKNFIGDLSGNANTCSLASNLVKNLDMCFNNLDVSGTITSKNIIPFFNNSSTLGNATKVWKNAYITDLSVSNRIDVVGNIKCNTIDVNGKTYTRDIFDSFLNQGNVTAFNFNDITLKNNIVLDNSNNNYIFFQDLYQTLLQNKDGVLDGSAISVTSKTFNNLSNFYYKLEITGFISDNEILFDYNYNDNVSQFYIFNKNNFNGTPFDNIFFTNKKYPVLFLYMRTTSKVIIATQNNNLKSISITSSNNFTANLYKLYAKPKGVNDGAIYTTSNFYYNGAVFNTSLNFRNPINVSDLYYTDKIGDNSNNIRIGTGLLNNASNQILIGNYNETFDRSGNNVILGNNYCEAWLPPQGYITDLGSSSYPFKNCFLSENLDVSNINCKSIIPSSNNSYTLGTATNFWQKAYITDLSINGTVTLPGAIFQNTGNVGIGTTNPNYKLHVNGTAFITGETIFTGTVSGISQTMIGLSNVTNESKTTMFFNPTFTGTVNGISAGMVGLANVTNESKTTMFFNSTFTGATILSSLTVGSVTNAQIGYLNGVTSSIQTQFGTINSKITNVTNESKSTMFFNPTFTGTVSGITPTMVSLGNVTNESKSTMFTSPIFTGNVGIGATNIGSFKLDVNGTTRATQFVSSIAEGTSPFLVTSNTVVTNLRSQYADYATTQAQTVNDTTIATTEFVTTKITSLNTTTQTALNLKANLASPTFTGSGTNFQCLINMTGNSITGCAKITKLSTSNFLGLYTSTDAADSNCYIEMRTDDNNLIIASSNKIYLRTAALSTVYGNEKIVIDDTNTNFYTHINMNNNNIIGAGEIYINNNHWLRIYGNRGVYWEDWQGGWFMEDAFWMKVWNNKSIYTTGTVQCGTVRANDPVFTGTINGTNITASTALSCKNFTVTNESGLSTYFNYNSSNQNYIRGTRTDINTFVYMNAGLDMGNTNITNCNTAGIVYLDTHDAFITNMYGRRDLDYISFQHKINMNSKDIYNANNVNATTVSCTNLFVDNIYHKSGLAGDNGAWIKFTDNSIKGRGYKTEGTDSYQEGWLAIYRERENQQTREIVSDARLKHNKEKIINSLSVLRKLQPQTYDMTYKFQDTLTISGEYDHRAGFVAQQIRLIEEISYCCIGEEFDSSNNPTPLAIDYNTIFTHGIAATQELDIIVQELVRKNENLENTVSNLQIKNEKLENTVTNLQNALNQLLIELGKNTI